MTHTPRVVWLQNKGSGGKSHEADTIIAGMKAARQAKDKVLVSGAEGEVDEVSSQ